MPVFPQTPTARRRRLRAGAVVTVVIVVAVLVRHVSGSKKVAATQKATLSNPAGPVAAAGLAAPDSYAPGVPPNKDPNNLYYYDGANMLSPSVAGEPARIYVPNTDSNSVSVIDPATYQVIRTVAVGFQPQHVSPSWDLSVLWVENDQGNSLTPIDPHNGYVGAPVPVDDPYNLYFTPDGTRAVVMAEARKRMDFRDPNTMARQKSVDVPCKGLNHLDFSPDGRTAVASCEFDGHLLLIDMINEKVLES